jgi:FAD/FMN-containing dehydrogenase
MEVVSGEGKLVTASEKENEDLFWGLRGGGGNFGVVTSFDYKLYPVGPEIIAGAIAWRAEDAPQVLEMYRGIIASAPREFTCVAAIRLAPPAPWLPKEIHGKPIVAFFVCHSGSIEQAEKDVAPIKAFGKPLGDIVIKRPYVGQQSIIDATQPKGRRYYWKSEYLPGCDEAMLPHFIDSGSRIKSPHAGIVLFPIDGALNERPADYSAVGNRDAKLVVNITGAWEKADDDAQEIEWVRSSWRQMRQFSTGGTYINFQTEDEGADRIQAAYGDNYERLAEVKRKWDPANLFSSNKNIAPASS